MASVSEQLLAALDELDTEKLKRFKWHLKNHKGFSAAAVKEADAPDTVDLINERFAPEEAVKITVDILRKLNCNHLAEDLENKHKQAQTESSIEDPAFVGVESKPINVTSTNIDLWTRNDFLQYSHQLTLDLNTVNKHLHLSENNREITGTDTDQPYPDHPDRFDYVCQVLCRESVCGRCYWELEWSGNIGVLISVSYKSISRKGAGVECLFGYNDQSWSLCCSHTSYSFKHNNIVTDLPVKPISRKIGVFEFRSRIGVYMNGNYFTRIGVSDGNYIYRVGVYVDYDAGTLSFYSVSDTMNLIHTIQTTFTQPLYPGFNIGYKSSVKLFDESEETDEGFYP